MRTKSLSNIIIVKPVERSSGNVNNDLESFKFGLETPISDSSRLPRANNEINRFNELGRLQQDVRHMGNKKVACAEAQFI
jgi:hypothetical protein